MAFTVSLDTVVVRHGSYHSNTLEMHAACKATYCESYRKDVAEGWSLARLVQALDAEDGSPDKESRECEIGLVPRTYFAVSIIVLKRTSNYLELTLFKSTSM